MDRQYVEQRDGGYWISGSRVSLDSVVFAFNDGLSPETIATECFPSLTLEEVYGAITYYLSHREAVDEYLQSAVAEHEALRTKLREADSLFAQKLTAAKRQTHTSRS